MPFCRVITRARELGVKFNKEKIQYNTRQVKYLGHVFSENGMQLDDNRVKAVLQLKTPTCKKELQRLLGTFNYFRSFIPNLSEVLAPLSSLLKNDVLFCWSSHHEDALRKVKKLLTEAPVLVNFDSSKTITIQSDASKEGLGCCLIQEGKPVCFAS